MIQKYVSQEPNWKMTLSRLIITWYLVSSSVSFSSISTAVSSVRSSVSFGSYHTQEDLEEEHSPVRPGGDPHPGVARPHSPVTWGGPWGSTTACTGCSWEPTPAGSRTTSWSSAFSCPTRLQNWLLRTRIKVNLNCNWLGWHETRS